ncbi:MAG: lysylphosphatidylglycerol synthase transmembrane domain-containing protein [Chloroflexota bacterium]|nr:lysylphosphatidylglycerol synthase transmembrane domain-containing protein [Chloroflexota bacterium]
MSSNVKNNRLLGKILRWIIPLGFSAVAFWLILREITFSQIIDQLAKINWRIYLLASLAFFMSYFFRVFCWFLILRRKVSYKNVFFTMGVGYLLNNIFPFRLGEIGRAVLLDDPQGPSALEVFATVLVERIFDVFLAAVFVLSMLPRIFGEGFDQSIFLIAFVLTLGGLILLFLVVRFRDRIMNWVKCWGEKASFMRTWVEPKVRQVLDGLTILNDPKAFLLAFFSLAISWFIAFGENYIIFQSLYPQPPFWWMIFVLSVGAFGAALPSAPAGLGVFEGVMVAAFALLGVGYETAFTHAIVIHALAFIFTNVLGLIGLRLRGEAASVLFHRVINRTKEIKPAG